MTGIGRFGEIRKFEGLEIRKEDDRRMLSTVFRGILPFCLVVDVISEKVLAAVISSPF